MNALTTICVVAAAVFFTGCASPQTGDEASGLVTKIRNTDIQWDGNYFGLHPKPSGASQKLLTEPADKVVPALMEALKDENRFVAAHVVLSEITASTKQGDAASWNGLRVNLLPNGQAVVPGGQQSVLIQQWADWRSKK